MFRLKVQRSFLTRPGYVIGTLDELQALAALPDCTVLPDPYNPPGFPGNPYDARQHPEAYAQQRANETGRPYLVTMQGHAWLDEPHNRAMAERDCGGVAGTFHPK